MYMSFYDLDRLDWPDVSRRAIHRRMEFWGTAVGILAFGIVFLWTRQEREALLHFKNPMLDFNMAACLPVWFLAQNPFK
jgi:hypothetical protein